jgi:hypothetical protein
MAKKIATSRPMTFDVLLPPFTEAFQIVPSDATQQWHYDADGSYLPDRAVTPLLLTPTLTVFDPDTKQTYTPEFFHVGWFLLNATTGKYDTEITNTVDGDVDYVLLSSGTLLVKKNVLETAPVNLLCEVEYIDPRNVGKTFTVREKVQLTTNRDTTVFSPRLELDQEALIEYNPFVDGYSRKADGMLTHTFAISARARIGTDQLDLTGDDSPYRIRWYAMEGAITAETLIDETVNLTSGGNVMGTFPKFPCYVSGQNTPTLTVDAMWTEQITVVARVVNTETGRIYPPKALTTLRWESFKVDATTEATDGGSVKQQTASRTFRNIVTLRNRTLSADQVNENFLQEFFFRKASKTIDGQTPTDSVESLGTAPEVTVSGDRLRSAGSSLVYSELTLLGAYKVVAQGDSIVVQDGKVVVCRY